MPDDTAARYLTVLGLVGPDDQLDLFPGFVTESDHRVLTDRDSPYVVELLGRGDTVLDRRQLPAQELCGDGLSTGGVALMGKVPYPDDTRAMRILRGDQVLLERTVSEQAPEVRLTWRPSDRPRDRESVTWEANHPADLPLHFIVGYDHLGDDGWRPVSLVTSATSHEVDLAHLPGGPHCRLTVLATDGFHTVQSTSAPFELPPRPCQAFVLAPLDGDQLPADSPVVLHGQGHWLEDDRVERDELRWFSSLDGELGRGATLTRRLRPGRHEITLVAGTEGRSSTTSVTVDVAGGSHPA